MKTFTDYLWMNTKKQKEIINITEDVRNIVQKSGIKEGLVLVSAMHITASMFYGEFDGQRKKRVVVKVMGE